MKQLFSQDFINDVLELSDRHLNKDLCQKIIFEITESLVAEDI